MARKERAIETIDVTITGGSTQILIRTNSTVYTNSFFMGDGVDFAITASFSAPAIASCNVGVFLEQSWGQPTVEGQDSSALSPTFVTVGTAAVSCGPINVWRHADLTTMPLPWGRFKLVGITTNTGAFVQIKLHKTVEG